MFFVWSQERINVKAAWWGPHESGKTTTLYALAAEILARVDDESADEPDEGLGMRRNVEPVEVDEPDTRFTTYFCHPPGDIGEFAEYPVHFQCKTPEKPREDNRAFDTVLDGISAVVFTADATRERQGANEASLRELVDRLADRYDIEAPGLSARIDALFGDEGPLRLVLQVNKSDAESAVGAEQVRRGLMLPDWVPAIETVALEQEGVWQVFETMAKSLRPLLEAAQERGRIPE